MDELEARRSLPFPLQHAVTQTCAGPAAQQGKAELMTLWAGQSASLCRCTDAAELMSLLITGTTLALQDLSRGAAPQEAARLA